MDIIIENSTGQHWSRSFVELTFTLIFIIHLKLIFFIKCELGQSNLLFGNPKHLHEILREQKNELILRYTPEVLVLVLAASVAYLNEQSLYVTRPPVLHFLNRRFPCMCSLGIKLPIPILFVLPFQSLVLWNPICRLLSHHWIFDMWGIYIHIRRISLLLLFFVFWGFFERVSTSRRGRGRRRENVQQTLP